jgi:hypothetical protein
MVDSIQETVAKIYDSNHVGVVRIQEVLNVSILEQLKNTFIENTERFYRLNFGNVTRWDLVDEDFQEHPTLEMVRKNFKNMTSAIAPIAGFNPVYKEKFSVMFYPKGSAGVQLHRDSEHSVNWVVIFVISGNNSFLVANTSACKDVIEFSTKPGDVVAMRGPRSCNDPLLRPLHFVGEVEKPRYVLISRHINLEKLKS